MPVTPRRSIAPLMLRRTVDPRVFCPNSPNPGCQTTQAALQDPTHPQNPAALEHAKSCPACRPDLPDPPDTVSTR